MSAGHAVIILPAGRTARLAAMAAGEGVSTAQMAAMLLSGALDREAPPPTPPPAHVPLEIGGLLTGAEALRLDTLALRQGVPPEALAAAAVRRLLKRAHAPVQTFRLKMPESARLKLEEHAAALGCRAGELAAFLFSRKSSRPQATVAGG